MFNEIEERALTEALLQLHAQAPTRMVFEIKLESLITALDRAGISGLILDGPRWRVNQRE